MPNSSSILVDTDPQTLRGLFNASIPLGTGGGGAIINNDGTVSQSERLFTARPRYAPRAKSPGDIYQKAPLARGQHAYIKLMTSRQQAAKYNNTKGVREYKDLTGPGSLVSGMVNTDPKLGYDRFLITSVSCQLQEKLQITEVFGDGEVAYYFGRQPMMFQISGVLVDSPDNTWFTDWLKMYSDWLRGSQLAQNYELLKLVLPNMILVGSMSGMSWAQDSQNDSAIQFNFQFLAKTLEPIPAVPQDISSTALANYIDFGKAVDFISQQDVNSVKKQAAELTSVITNPASTVAEIGGALLNYGKGVGGQMTGGIAATVRDWVNGNSFSTGLRNTASMFRTVSAALDGVRASLFSPIYGVLTSLTKLVSNTFGDIQSIFSSVFTPVRNILRDITNISRGAIALVNLVNSSIRGLGRSLNSQIAGTRADFNVAMKTLGEAAGAIATSPMTALQSVQDLFKGGSIGANAAFLRPNLKATLSYSSALNSGTSRVNTKIAMLTSAPSYTSKRAAAI